MSKEQWMPPALTNATLEHWAQLADERWNEPGFPIILSLIAEVRRLRVENENSNEALKVVAGDAATYRHVLRERFGTCPYCWQPYEADNEAVHENCCVVASIPPVIEQQEPVKDDGHALSAVCLVDGCQFHGVGPEGDDK